ncbi:transcription factor MYBS3-like [Rhodamnia argentea]|uniref:Transcription factor MYBS3-like n=1 Tax=Rhodamnia argentea TaxID=178133 RepID=A0A8B8NS42_9MYRT|nr:transcription factor MYBS3-like [Rhodamnia argentea]
MTRRCSHCCNKGHNSRTCPVRSAGDGGGAAANTSPSSSSSSTAAAAAAAAAASASSSGGGVKLFGVRLTDGSIMKKSASVGCLSAAHYHSSSSAAASPNPGSSPMDGSDGYLSDDPAHGSRSSNRRVERKKGNPWTEEEHRRFLIGLQKLGKGDWRGIARDFVTTRSPTQVASHAQKYYIRQSNAGRRKRRSSLFDINPDMATADQPSIQEETFLPPLVRVNDDTNSTASTSIGLDLERTPMETSHPEMFEGCSDAAMESTGQVPLVPCYFPYLFPVPFPMWPPNVVPPEDGMVVETSHHRVLKPIPVIPKEPINIDQIVGMSQLSLAENEPSPLSLKFLGGTSRQSAFSKAPSVNELDLDNCKDGGTQAA